MKATLAKRVALGIGTCIIGGNSAFAYTEYSLNPNVCVVAGASASTNVYHGGGGVVYNNNSNGGSTVTLVCPLLSTQGWFGLQNKPELLVMEVVDDYGSSDLSCQFTGWRVDASSGNRVQDYDIYNPTTGVPANQDSQYWIQIDWQFTPANALSETHWGINCTIPPKDASGNPSKIATIFLDEETSLGPPVGDP